MSFVPCTTVTYSNTVANTGSCHCQLPRQLRVLAWQKYFAKHRPTATKHPRLGKRGWLTMRKQVPRQVEVPPAATGRASRAFVGRPAGRGRRHGGLYAARPLKMGARALKAHRRQAPVTPNIRAALTGWPQVLPVPGTCHSFRPPHSATLCHTLGHTCATFLSSTHPRCTFFFLPSPTTLVPTDCTSFCQSVPNHLPVDCLLRSQSVKPPFRPSNPENKKNLPPQTTPLWPAHVVVYPPNSTPPAIRFCLGLASPAETDYLATQSAVKTGCLCISTTS